MMRYLFFILLICPATLLAQLLVSTPLEDNMVLQQGRSFGIKGTGKPGQAVVVTFRNRSYRSNVQPDSSWTVQISSLRPSAVPAVMNIASGGETLRFSNILCGDVWLFLGQSNMGFPMKNELHYKQEHHNSQQPLLRFYNPSYAGKNIYNAAFTDSVVALLNGNDFYKGRWEACDSNSLANMSAVAYYFGKEVSRATKMPQGLVHLAIGGAPLETFIRREALLADSRFAAKAGADWLNNESLPAWIRERGSVNTQAKSPVRRNNLGAVHAYQPGFAYEMRVADFTQLPVKGVLFYQGESNSLEAPRVQEYAQLFKLMIDDYRAVFEQPDLPFYYVQLSSIDTTNYKATYWPWFRDEQRKIMSLAANTGMAVSSDIGHRTDVHPVNKKLVGERLAKWALHANPPSGPLPLKATYQNGAVAISFHYGKGLKSAGNTLTGFSIDGKQPAAAIIRKGKVIVPAAGRPAYIYYAWEPFTTANLVNGAGLPASTFKIPIE